MKSKINLTVWLGIFLLGFTLLAGCSSKTYHLSPIAPASVIPTNSPTPNEILMFTPSATPTMTLTVQVPSTTPTKTHTPIPQSTDTPTITSTPTSAVTSTATTTSTATATATAWVVAGTADNFTIEVLDATLPVCVEFYATWCTQCAYFYPGLMNFAADEAGHVKVVRIDGDLYPGLCSTYGVTGYPTTIFFKNGVEANRFAGGTHVAATDEAILINIFNNI